MRLPIALGAYKREAAFLPELRLRNLIVEATPADDEKVVLIARPGLVVSQALLGSSVKAVWTDKAVFSGDVIALADTSLYRGASVGGTLVSAAADAAEFASLPGQLVFCNAGTLYRYDGTSLTQPAFPDGAAVCSVAMLDSYFLAVRSGTAKLYWSAVADGTSWPALNFASAESHADNLLDVVAVSDQLALVGQESIEFWQATSDANLPFGRIDGLTFAKGALNTGAAIYVDNTLVWVGNDGIVYRRGAVPQRLSDHGIEEQITQSGVAYLFSFVWAGHTILVLRLAAATWFYDFETKEWSEASSYGVTGWRAQCGCFNGLTSVFGDATAANVLTLTDGALYDVDDIIERSFTAVLSDQAIIDNLWLDAQGGIGSEPGGDPILVELTISRDGGQTFGPYLQSDLGKRGEYRKRAVWRRLGRYDMSTVFRFRCTDPASFTVQSIRVNEPLAGRGT